MKSRATFTTSVSCVAPEGVVNMEMLAALPNLCPPLPPASCVFDWCYRHLGAWNSSCYVILIKPKLQILIHQNTGFIQTRGSHENRFEHKTMVVRGKWEGQSCIFKGYIAAFMTEQTLLQWYRFNILLPLGCNGTALSLLEMAILGIFRSELVFDAYSFIASWFIAAVKG